MTDGNRNEARTDSNGNNNFDFQLAKDAMDKFREQMQGVFNFVMIDLGGYEIFNVVAQWCIRNPTVFCCILALVLVVMLPALILVGFGVSTILMTFTGFLVLEGTLLTGLLMLLFSCLGGLVLILLFFVTFGAAIYYGFVRLYDIYGSFGHVIENRNNKKHDDKENKVNNQNNNNNSIVTN